MMFLYGALAGWMMRQRYPSIGYLRSPLDMVDPGIALCLGVRAEVYLPGYLIFLALVSYSKTILKRKKKTSLLFPLKIGQIH